MALWNPISQPSVNGRNGHGRLNGQFRPRYVAPPPPLPPFMTRLNWLCGSAKHALPVRMQFVGIGYSHKGQPYADYRCPLCGAMHAVVVNAYNGKPKPLFTHNG